MSLEWRVEARRLLLDRPPWFEVYEASVRLPSGRLVEDFYTIAIPDDVETRRAARTTWPRC
jgi:hypothetical protein